MSDLKRHIPNMLSAYRIAVVPVIAACFYTNTECAIWLSTFLFFIACVTDYLDGVIARRNGYSSIFGKFLDATSDKILIVSVLMILIGFGHITGYWMMAALIIFIREILVSGLREFLGQYKIAVPVTWIGKWKTATQMFACGFLMAGEYGPEFVPYSVEIGYGALLIATLMTVISGTDYLTAGMKTIREIDAKESN